VAGLTLESALLAAIVLVLIGLLSVSFASRPASAIPLLLLVEMASVSSIPQAVMVGQFHVYPGDIITVALAAATLMRCQQRGDGPRPSRPLVVLLAILLLSMARGAAAFGLQPSVVAARQILLMLVAAVFFSTVRVTPQLVRAVRNWLLLASAVLILVAVNFWLQHGFGTYAATGGRALDSLQALFVLETTIVTVVFPPFRGPVLRWVVPLVGFFVVVLSVQRTVWAAGLVAAAVLVVARQKSRGATSIAGRRLLVATAVLAVVLLVATGPPGVTSSLTAGYQQTSAIQNSTFSWRLQGWSAMINRQRAGPVADLVVGSPSGTGNESINEAVFLPAFHSQYLWTLSMTGIIGLALLLWVYVTALRKSRRRLRSPSAFVGQVALLFTALLALQLTFFVGYSSGGLVGLMLGIACGFVNDPSVDRSQHLMPATTERF
jgi:O-antigen ligase